MERSKIPKLPVPSRANTLSSFAKRKAMTALTEISNSERKNLVNTHTKPGNTFTSTNNTSAPAALKRNGLRTVAPVPAKQAKVEKKPAKVAPKIPPYDYKARFNDLLEKHKVMKNELMELKERHEEISDDYEKIKDSEQSASAENASLLEKLKMTLNNLKKKTAEFDKLKLDSELEKLKNEELTRKTEVLTEVSKSLERKSLDFDKLEAAHNVLKIRYDAIKEETEALRVLTDNLKKISIDHDRLLLEHSNIKHKCDDYKKEVEFLQNMLAGMHQEQRDLRNTVQDLRGNIRVYCRVRPPLVCEESKPLFNLNVLDACSIEVEKISLNSFSQSSKKGKQTQGFSFDGIFSPHSSQEDVFAEVSPMIQSALDGYNVCIFAYGQTGSGKTFTMEGGSGKEQYGIIPRAFDMIFTCLDGLKKMGWELNISASFLEIYNENIYDLLNSSKEQGDHDIKMVDSKGTDVYVSNLKHEEVTSCHDFIKLMIFAQRNRQTAATLNNERSSRSHSVTQVKINAINTKRKEKFTSHLNLVDLAGSESGKTTQRMDETKHINRSLSELSKVILALQTNQSHIPYRNSKLTYLLMPSLGGNSKTLMMVNISQLDECFGETLNSLRFATKVNSCRTVKAKKNLTLV